MRSAVKIGVAAVLAVAMMGADGGCEKRGRVESDRPASDKKVDPAKARRAGIEVNGTGPYEVFVHVERASGDGGSDQTREEVAGGRYTQTVDYTSGVRLRIRVNVKGHRDDRFSCKIIDGLPGQTPQDLPVGGLAVDYRGPQERTVYCSATTTG